MELQTSIITLAIIGNVCNFAYNVPFVYVVVKNKSAENISKKFLYLRIFSGFIWITYSTLTLEVYVGISYAITLISSFIILYIKLNYDNPPNHSPIFLKETNI
jgi:uncharacterized protein with PQ loop repeat